MSDQEPRYETVRDTVKISMSDSQEDEESISLLSEQMKDWLQSHLCYLQLCFREKAKL